MNFGQYFLYQLNLYAWKNKFKFLYKKSSFVLNSKTDASGTCGENAVVFVYQQYRPYLST